MTDAAIQVEGLGKRYHIGAARKDRTASQFFRDVLMAPVDRLRRFGRSSHREEDTIWALNDVSFEVPRGEVLGIIGRNGAGKSTLLKLLTRITEPSTGRAVIRGRVGSLLEVGTGFHPELTGRENIYFSGSLLGMKQREIRSRFDEIVDFSGISKFLDTPIKRYSSGMRVRLGFAVAAHLDPEILLIDEVLAVGDAEFQRRCLGKMEGLTSQGRTILFVSHNMPSIEALCDRAILLEDGQIALEGESSEVTRRYLRNDQCSLRAETDLSVHAGRTPGSASVLQTLRFLNKGTLSSQVELRGPMTIEVELGPGIEMVRSPRLQVHVLSGMGLSVCRFISDHMGLAPQALSPGHRLSVNWDRVSLQPGQYTLNLHLRDGHRSVDKIISAAMFEVLPKDVSGTGKLDIKAGVFVPEANWELLTDGDN